MCWRGDLAQEEVLERRGSLALAVRQGTAGREKEGSESNAEGVAEDVAEGAGGGTRQSACRSRRVLGWAACVGGGSCLFLQLYAATELWSGERGW